MEIQLTRNVLKGLISTAISIQDYNLAVEILLETGDIDLFELFSNNQYLSKSFLSIFERNTSKEAVKFTFLLLAKLDPQKNSCIYDYATVINKYIDVNNILISKNYFLLKKIIDVLSLEERKKFVMKNSTDFFKKSIDYYSKKHLSNAEKKFSLYLIHLLLQYEVEDEEETP